MLLFSINVEPVSGIFEWEKEEGEGDNLYIEFTPKEVFATGTFIVGSTAQISSDCSRVTFYRLFCMAPNHGKWQKNIGKKLDAFQRKCLRRIVGVNWSNTISNKTYTPWLLSAPSQRRSRGEDGDGLDTFCAFQWLLLLVRHFVGPRVVREL